MRFHFLVVVSIAVLAASEADTAKKTTAPATTKTSKRIPVRISKNPTRSSGTSAGKSNVRASAASYRAPQAGPTSDRYKEIQESLISKGYLEGPATGVWDQNSMAGMKKFQEDQKLEPSGKVTAKALIILGLGPKDESAPTPNTNK